MKFLTPMELRSVNFKKINQLYESKEIGFVGFNFDTFHTVSPRSMRAFTSSAGSASDVANFSRTA